MEDKQTEWEQETLALIHDAETEKCRAEQRVEVAKAAVQERSEEIRMLYAVIDRYRRKYGIHSRTIERSPPLEAEYGRLSPWETMELWAKKHDGDIIMRDLCHAVIAAGIYRDYTQAAGTFYSLARRKPTVMKIGKGHYVLKQEEDVQRETVPPLRLGTPMKPPMDAKAASATPRQHDDDHETQHRERTPCSE